MAASPAPGLRLERTWLAEGCVVVAGSDEVGRGALAGPVTAGVIVIDATTKRPPTGLRDSKLLTPEAREALVPRIERWAAAFGVGHASPQEIDALGILAALRLAGERALATIGIEPDVMLLDGNYDWWTRPPAAPWSPRETPLPRVELKIKADLACATAAAASVIAKVTRDRLMCELADSFPEYQWHRNKGYAAPEHRAAILEHGPCEHHRKSWNLPGSGGEQLELDW